MDEILRRAQRRYQSAPDAETADAYIAALERVAGIPRNPPEYEIHLTLVLSTAHIPESEVSWIGTHGSLVWATNDYGWIFVVPQDEDIFESTIIRYPGHLARLLRLAHNQNCDWLRLDADGRVDANLPTWEW